MASRALICYKSFKWRTGSEVTVPITIEHLQAGVAPALALLAGMQLDLFSRIGDSFATPTALAEELGVGPDRLLRLLNALTLTGLLHHDGGRYANSPELRAFPQPSFAGFLLAISMSHWQISGPRICKRRSRSGPASQRRCTTFRTWTRQRYPPSCGGWCPIRQRQDGLWLRFSIWRRSCPSSTLAVVPVPP